jgi:hypothetical protein
MGDERVLDWEGEGWLEEFMAVLRARRSSSKESIEVSNSVCASWVYIRSENGKKDEGLIL